MNKKSIRERKEEKHGIGRERGLEQVLKKETQEESERERDERELGHSEIYSREFAEKC